jgi:hypothetical protein
MINMNNRIYTQDEIDALMADLAEFMGSKSFGSAEYHDIFDMMSSHKYYEPSDLLDDMSSWEIEDFCRDRVDRREITDDYLSSLSDAQLVRYLSEFDTELVLRPKFKSLDDGYRYALCVQLAKKITSSFELERLLGDDLTRELRYSIRL